MNYDWLLFNNKYNPKTRVCSEDSNCTKCPQIMRGCPGYRKPILDKEGDTILVRPLLKKYSLSNEGELETDIDYGEMEKRYDYDMGDRGYIKLENVLEILKRDYFIDLLNLKYYSRNKLIEPPIVFWYKGRGSISYYKNNTSLIIYLIETMKKIRKFKLREIKHYLEKHYLIEKLINLLELDNLTEVNKIIGDLTNIDKTEMDTRN